MLSPQRCVAAELSLREVIRVSKPESQVYKLFVFPGSVVGKLN